MTIIIVIIRDYSLMTRVNIHNRSYNNEKTNRKQYDIFS